jgi:hypothetical protein
MPIRNRPLTMPDRPPVPDAWHVGASLVERDDRGPDTTAASVGVEPVGGETLTTFTALADIPFDC